MLSLSISFQFYHMAKKELNEFFIFNFNFLFFLKKQFLFLFYLTCLLIYVDVGPWLVFPTQVDRIQKGIEFPIYIYKSSLLAFVVILG